MKKALVIEDDRDIVELLDIHLRDLNCLSDKAHDGRRGLELALRGDYDLLVLDVMLPGLDGIEVCRRIRARDIGTPILMLTARSEEIDRVLGLEIGADDYLTKPFSLREFIARVKALFRRVDRYSGQQEGPGRASRLVFGDLAIDLDKRKVSIRDQRIDLSPKEFELLRLLASEPGKSYDRSRILNLVWGHDFEGYAHTVNAHINRLRGKIEPDMQHPTYILTTWGVGYRFNEELST